MITVISKDVGEVRNISSGEYKERLEDRIEDYIKDQLRIKE